ncbi:uncharacterized protein LOC128874113 isoform X1 [Hylaeus volcanicus]|uniref:uncharacterized protein LOC128874113 isoform X1 n=1 Tax=Hylaeus volcanicus TaxID=313075 RepID=UPI0023B810E3|nr:uncharacterized protein LOC128874113 isoform X1 [Hylaeus volcanicus]
MIPLLLLSVLHSFAFDGNTMLKELGEKRYQTIKAKSTLSQHGLCWHNALKTITNSCNNLNDQQHSLLALQLAQCFLEDSGHSSYNCHLSMSEKQRRDCINNMSDRAFNVYNEFYIHTTHICFYLNYEAWQAETDNTIKELYQVSSRMREQLLEASEMQGAMLETQRESLKMQDELLVHGKQLGIVIKSSSASVQNMVKDFKESAKDQRELLFEIFSYLRTFQDWILGEISWFQSIMYYTVSCILCALFSSSKRTVDARITLFTILSVNVIVERMLVQYYSNNTSHSNNSKENLINTTWMYRKIALILCAISLFCTYYFYKDEQVENHKVLKRIEHRLNTIQEVTSVCNTNCSIRYSTRLAMKRLQSKANTENKVVNSL